MRLEGAPSPDWPWSDPSRPSPAANPRISSLFTAVVPASSTSITSPGPVRTRADGFRLRAGEWARAEQDALLAVQAYEGALRPSRVGGPTSPSTTPCGPSKSVAGLAEETLLRLRRSSVAAPSPRSPFAHCSRTSGPSASYGRPGASPTTLLASSLG